MKVVIYILAVDQWHCAFAACLQSRWSVLDVCICIPISPLFPANYSFSSWALFFYTSSMDLAAKYSSDELFLKLLLQLFTST